MRIAVCIKQVPGTTQVAIDPKTGVLLRDGMDAKMNPYDLHALEAALYLKELTGATVRALSMGPPQAAAVIREAYWMGADEGLLISDRCCAGSDVLATAYALSQGLRQGGLPDLIICGQMTTDGDTAQVGPEIAEFLGIPHVTMVTGIQSLEADRLMLTRDLGGVDQMLAVRLPALITVDRHLNQPRLPSFRRKLATAEQAVPICTRGDFEDQDATHYGLDGSPTQVVKIFPPEHHQEQEHWHGSGSELGVRLAEALLQRKFVVPGQSCTEAGA